MAVKKEALVKVSFRIRRSDSEQFTKWAEQLSMSKSNFLSQAALIGARAIMRQAFPEEFLSPDLIKQMMSAGFPFDKSG